MKLALHRQSLYQRPQEKGLLGSLKAIFFQPMNWLWLAFSVFVLAVPWPMTKTQPTERNFQIKASQFDYNPPVIHVNPYDRVTVELLSMDVVHGIFLDGYNLEVKSDPGQSTKLTFIADRSGTYRFRCSVTCGALHPFMIGKIQVGQNTLLYRGIGLALIVSLAGIWNLRR